MGYSPFDKQDRYELAIERGLLVDPCDEWLLYEYTWSIKDKRWPYGYTTKVIDGIRYTALLHHMIVGYPINNHVVDHIDRNPKNNKRSNLRIVSQSTNLYNKPANDYEDNYVHHVPDRRLPWRVSIPFGHFATQEEAINARNKILEILRRDEYPI